MAIEILGKVTLDTSQPDAALDHVAEKGKLIDDTKHPIAIDTKAAEHAFEGLAEKGKSALSGIGAGLFAGGAAIGIEKGIDAYKELLKSQSDLKIAIAGTNKSQSEQAEVFAQSKEEVDALSGKYHLHEEAIAGVETSIIGIGGVTGQAKGKLTEIGLAMEQLNIPSKALKGIIAGSADPDSLQAFDALKKKIGDLGPEFANAQTPAEKTDALYKRLSGTLSGMANLDPELAAMQDMDISTKKLEQSGGQLILGFLAPLIPILTGAASIMSHVVSPAVSGTTKFIQDNKVAVGILAAGLGIMAISMNAAAIGTTALSIGQKAAAISTQAVTAAQWLWNAALNANPIGLIIGAIGVLIGVGVLLYNNFDIVKKTLDGVWNAIKTAIPFVGAIAALFGSSSEETKKSSDALTANADATKQAADAQKAMTDAILGANAAFADQQKSAKDTIDLNKQQFERQSQYIASGYAEVSGSLVKLTADQVAAYKKSNAELIAQAKSREAELKAVDKSGKAFDAVVDPKAKGDLLSIAKQQAEEKSKELEVELRLAAARAGVAFSARDELAVEQKKNQVFAEQVKQYDLLNSKKYSQKATLDISTGTTKELEINAKIKIDDQKAHEDFDKATLALTKKQIEVGILPKTEGIKVLDGEIDHVKQKLTLLAAVSILNPGDLKSLTEIKQLQSQVIDLEKERKGIALDVSNQIAEARISNITDEVEKSIAERTFQYNKEVQFAKDAIDSGRDLNDQERELQKQLTIKYEADISKIKLGAAKTENDAEKKLIEGGVTLFVDSLKQMLTAQKSFDSLAYEDKKLQLDKQRGQVEKDYQQGKISAREYNLDLQKLQADRAKNEQQAEQAKFAFIKNVSDQAYKALEDNVTKFAVAEGQAALQGLANDKEDQQSSLKTANSTMVGAVAKLISGWIGVTGPVGAVIGVAAGIALMAAFSGIEKSLGFAKGGTWVGENGPEIVSPKSDFSQMASQIVTQTALEVRRSMQQDSPRSGNGGRSNVRVSVGGQLRVRGRDMDTALKNEAISARNERLITV